MRNTQKCAKETSTTSTRKHICLHPGKATPMQAIRRRPRKCGPTLVADSSCTSSQTDTLIAESSGVCNE
eukprot:828962-Pleurochrysis_carterae.AAC.1